MRKLFVESCNRNLPNPKPKTLNKPSPPESEYPYTPSARELQMMDMRTPEEIRQETEETEREYSLESWRFWTKYNRNNRRSLRALRQSVENEEPLNIGIDCPMLNIYALLGAIHTGESTCDLIRKVTQPDEQYKSKAKQKTEKRLQVVSLKRQSIELAE